MSFAIVDCNSFYCSCERVFRPDLAEKPVVVLSNNDGCIISRSDEAKKLGIGMAGPYFLAKHAIEKNNVTVFSSNYHLYGDMSWRVMECLRLLSEDGPTKRVEVYSVDEAFIDLHHLPVGEHRSFATHLKETVEHWTGISVSVGIAPTKTLAKIANHLAKKDKKATACVSVIGNEQQRQDALQQTRVSGIWGVGRAYADKLINWGITSAWELSHMREEWAHKNLGGIVGVRLLKELNGEPSLVMNKELTSKKMIATTRMFGRNVTELSELKEAVATYISRAAEKLRRQQCAAKYVSVFIVPKESDQPFSYSSTATKSTHIHLQKATSSTHELIKPAVQMVEQLFENGLEYKKAGVLLGELVPDDAIQGSLFLAESSNRKRYLMSAIDNVNFGMRDDCVKFGSSGLERNWKMRQELRSGRYSSRWEELMQVK